MGIEEFEDMMPHLVTIEPFQAQDGYGKRTYTGAVNTFQAYIMGKRTHVIGAGGEERVSKQKIILGGTPTVDVRDRITLPAPFVPDQPEILGVDYESDEEGHHHTVVLT
jgi:hypothetical protein